MLIDVAYDVDKDKFGIGRANCCCTGHALKLYWTRVVLQLEDLSWFCRGFAPWWWRLHHATLPFCIQTMRMCLVCLFIGRVFLYSRILTVSRGVDIAYLLFSPFHLFIKCGFNQTPCCIGNSIIDGRRRIRFRAGHIKNGTPTDAPTLCKVLIFPMLHSHSLFWLLAMWILCARIRWLSAQIPAQIPAKQIQSNCRSHAYGFRDSDARQFGF